MSQTLTVGAILYPGFEMLDLFGPHEMYSMLGPDAVQIVTVAEQAVPVTSAVSMAVDAGPQVVAQANFENAPSLDILLVPGGFGTPPALENAALMNFLSTRAGSAQVVSSVCTGSALLAKAGLLDGRRATSNKQLFALSTQITDQVDWVESARWVEDGKFWTSSGVSAGMDMTLAIIAKLAGEETAESVSSGTEYTWHRDADTDPFASELNKLAHLLE